MIKNYEFVKILTVDYTRFWTQTISVENEHDDH